MKITMSGKYAFEDKPTEQVRIICVDAGKELPVVGLTASGSTFRRKANGTQRPYAPLITLQRKPREFWVNVYPMHDTIYGTETMARKFRQTDGKTIHVREVLE